MIENIIKSFRNLVKYPDLKSAKVLCTKPSKHVATSNSLLIETSWTSRNLENNERINYHVNYFVHNESDSSAFPSVISDKRVVLSAVDESGLQTASISQNDDSCYLTITDENSDSSSLNLKELEIHEKVYTDVELASFCWSPDKSKLVYVAEKKRPKASTYFSKASEKVDDGRGKKFTYIDDWGEQMTDQHQGCIIVVDTKSLETKVLNLPEEWCCGQVVWTPEGNSVAGVAFRTTPFRHGLIYCRNRESILFCIDMEENFTNLCEEGYHFQSPRFSRDGSTLAFIKSPIGGPHVRAAQLCLMTWKDKKVNVLIDFVDQEVEVLNGAKFNGLCGLTHLPRRCWSNDSTKIIFSAMGHFGYSSYVIDTESKVIGRLPMDGNAVVHDILEDYVIISNSSCVEPTKVSMMKLPSKIEDIKPDWVAISSRKIVEDIPLDWQDSFTFVNSNAHPDPTCSILPIPVLYFGPTHPNADGSKRPLIVWAHGGPHSVFPNAFVLGASFFVKLGYSIIFPNFRGSLGQGRKALESLPGHCGLTDVDDVYQATNQSLKRYSSVLDPEKVVLFGGSHGGFLVTHLAAQHPDMYKVVSTRNPVVEISSMTSVTDIPDWNFVEAGSDYNPGKNVDVSISSRMLEISPMNIIDKVKAPTLLLLGAADRRVPMSQGLRYHRLLLARKVPTKCFVYDDCHALSKVDVEADAFVQTALFFHTHLNQKNQ